MPRAALAITNAPENTRMSMGTVVFIDPARGKFGFISTDREERLFFRLSEIVGAHVLTPIYVGMPVTFTTTVKDARGSRAIGVRIAASRDFTQRHRRTRSARRRAQQ